MQCYKTIAITIATAPGNWRCNPKNAEAAQSRVWKIAAAYCRREAARARSAEQGDPAVEHHDHQVALGGGLVVVGGVGRHLDDRAGAVGAAGGAVAALEDEGELVAVVAVPGEGHAGAHAHHAAGGAG